MYFVHGIVYLSLNCVMGDVTRGVTSDQLFVILVEIFVLPLNK